MSSPTPRKRSKSKQNPYSSSSASQSSLSAIIEPPQSLFPSKGEFLRLVAVLAIASEVAFSCSFVATFFSSTSKPFCDSNLDPTDSSSDVCEPCPSNGECYEGKLECIYGYRRHGKLCIEDRDINETAKKLYEWVEAGLCEAYAQLRCYGTGTIWVRENYVRNDLDEHKLMQNFGSDHTTYVYTKRRAMKTIADKNKSPRCADAQAEYYKPLSCRIRELVSKHALIIVPVFAALIGCAVLFWKVRQRMYLSARAEELYNQVEELVQGDSRVDRYPKLVKGESKVVWE